MVSSLPYTPLPLLFPHPTLLLLRLACRLHFLQWNAPEVCVGTRAGTEVTTACDVYMLGGLLYELLTAGTPPFHWCDEFLQLLHARRRSKEPVRVPGVPVPAPGLLGKSVVEAAEVDGVRVPWCVQDDELPGSPGRLVALQKVMGQCLQADPRDRPALTQVLDCLEELLREEELEEAVVKATTRRMGTPSGSGHGSGGGDVAGPGIGAPVDYTSIPCADPFVGARGGAGAEVALCGSHSALVSHLSPRSSVRAEGPRYYVGRALRNHLPLPAAAAC